MQTGVNSAVVEQHSDQINTSSSLHRDCACWLVITGTAPAGLLSQGLRLLACYHRDCACWLVITGTAPAGLLSQGLRLMACYHSLSFATGMGVAHKLSRAIMMTIGCSARVPSVCLAVSLSFSLFLYLSLSLSVWLSLCLFLYFSIPPCLCLSLSVCLSVSHSLCLCLSVSLYWLCLSV